MVEGGIVRCSVAQRVRASSCSAHHTRQMSTATPLRRIDYEQAMLIAAGVQIGSVRGKDPRHEECSDIRTVLVGSFHRLNRPVQSLWQSVL